jgi:hypothetical protein
MLSLIVKTLLETRSKIFTRLKLSKKLFWKMKIKLSTICVALKISLRKTSNRLNLGLQLFKKLETKKKIKTNQVKKKNKKLRKKKLKKEKRKTRMLSNKRRDFSVKLKIKLIGKQFNNRILSNSKVKHSKRVRIHQLQWSKSKLQTKLQVEAPQLLQLQLQTKLTIDHLKTLLLLLLHPPQLKKLFNKKRIILKVWILKIISKVKK